MGETSDRLLDAARAMLQAAPDGLERTSLMKALFYVDLEWLLETGSTLTGATWVAFERGPVVHNYKTTLLQPLINSEEFREVRETIAGGMEMKRLERNPTRESLDALAHFPDHAQVLLRRYAEVADRKAPAELSEFSHQNPAWKRAFSNGKNTPLDMVLAMQQIADEDPWLDTPCRQDELACIKAAFLPDSVTF